MMNNKTQLVSVPRELLERILAYAWFPSGDVTVFDLRLVDREQLSALLAAPAEDVRAVVEEPVAVAMSFEFEHPSSKEKRTVTLKKRDVFDGMEDYFYDKLTEQICQCESVGETNVIDCNCDEYVHDFEIVNACLDSVEELNKC